MSRETRGGLHGVALRLISSSFLMILAHAFCASAQSEAGNDRLQEIEAEVQKEAKQLERLRTQVAQLQLDLKNSESSLASLRQRELNSGEELRRVLAEKASLDAELQQLRDAHAKLSRLSATRIRALYKGELQTGVTPRWFFADQKSVQKTAYYTNIVYDHDRNLLKQLAIMGKAIRDKSVVLGGLVKNRDAIKSDLAAQRKKIAARVVSQRRVIEELKSKENALNTTLTSLRAQALRLETVVASMTSGRTPDYYGTQKPAARTRAVPGTFDGKGLRAQKDSIVPPVTDWRIERRFGKQRVPGFKEMVLSKGLELHMPAVAEVKAIAAGRVLFSGRMPGYGTILILDHGERSYSLYGQLGAVQVVKGAIVPRGQVIATTGGLPSGNGGRLYFEVRKNGKSVDPGFVFD